MYIKRVGATPKQCIPLSKRPPPVKIKVQRQPILNGLSVLMGKPFQRPMTKRRAYGKQQNQALRTATLGPRKRMDGMARLMARAGRGLTFKAPKTRADNDDGGDTEEDDSSEDEKEEDRPFEPLRLWNSPHQEDEDGTPYEPLGLPPRMTRVKRFDDCGIEEEVTVFQPPPKQAYAKEHVYVPPVLAKWLRPHQREGVKFMYECVMGLKGYDGNGCILADDMGLGKTLQSVTLIFTLLKTHITAKAEPTAKRVIVVCPCSLVKNWDNEFVKWLGPNTVKTLALAEADRKKVERDIDTFVRTNMFNVLIASYECIRTHVGRLLKAPSGTSCCDLLVCDEAHRLKNSENQTSRALNSIPVKRRVLLTGTPMQNDLQEFFAMVDFTNSGVLGTQEEFRKKMLAPILRGREPDASDAEKNKMLQIQNGMSQTVNDFILRRVNTLNAQHLPPKYVEVVCCNLTDIQRNMYEHLIESKDMQHAIEGKQSNCLGSIQALMKLCNHPSLIAEEDKSGMGPIKTSKRSSKVVRYNEDEKATMATPGADGVSKFMPTTAGESCGRNGRGPVHPEWSGKMFVLYRLMREMRKPGNGNDKIVIISNYTQTLDLIGRMCSENSWGFCRLDGSINMKKRQKMVDDFNDPYSSVVAFLLSSKAGGCGLNLIGGNRLVLFDPDWNPAVDKQAAARCWRDGQKKRCFTYRFLATGTVEEKIFQRQLSKEGLQSVVDDKEQVNALSTKDLRNLFKLRSETNSDTHDKLRCQRCEIFHDTAELEEAKVLPQKLEKCKALLAEMEEHEGAGHFLKVLNPTEYGTSKEEYEKIVKQPMDFGTIRANLLKQPDLPGAYKSVSAFSKDVNRVFQNVLKVWPEGTIADAARELQTFWLSRWRETVTELMEMNKTNKQEEDGGKGADVSACQEEDDHQEQIGMPDEENMRDWAHHHSMDTVVDPIFQAAMKGYDTVSFVFALEVTWSLIQQRQQEEEERQAMKALEELEECEIENLDCKPTAKETPKACCDNAENAGDESDSSEDEDTTPNGGETKGANESKTEDNAEEMTSEDESDNDSVPAAPPAAAASSAGGNPFEDSDDDEEEISNKRTSDDAAAPPPKKIRAIIDDDDDDDSD